MPSDRIPCPFYPDLFTHSLGIPVCADVYGNCNAGLRLRTFPDKFQDCCRDAANRLMAGNMTAGRIADLSKGKFSEGDPREIGIREALVAAGWSPEQELK